MRTVAIPGAILTIFEEDELSPSKVITKKGHYCPAQARARLSSHMEAMRVEKERRFKSISFRHVDNAKRRRPERGGVRFVGA